MMMSQVAQALAATLHGNDVLMTGVSKDTRDLQTGDMYIALKGERFDGHQFIANADAAGAVGMLVSDLQSADILKHSAQVQVEDTRIALGQLAAYWCQQWRDHQTGGELIAITGSNGKTSVKEMCNKILSDFAGQSCVLATKGNLNNDIGMPMTLLELRQQHQYAVIEMGANHVGEIDYLTKIAKPDVAIINNVGPAHLEGFGSLENIAKAKAEIFHGLLADDLSETGLSKTGQSRNGIAVFNRDDDFAPYWDDCTADMKTVDFSMQDESAGVYAKKTGQNSSGKNQYLVTAGTEQAQLTLKVPGKHNVMNALAAIAATYSLGLSLHSIVDSLSEFENISGRLTVKISVAGIQVIDDSYNANPSSTDAAIDVLADKHASSSILVLGDMAELGSETQSLHAAIGIKAKNAGINYLYSTGKFSADAADAFGENGFHFEDKKALMHALDENLTGSEVVLIKGSRSAAMEEVVEWILTRKIRPGKDASRATQEQLQNNNKRVN